MNVCYIIARQLLPSPSKYRGEGMSNCCTPAKCNARARAGAQAMEAAEAYTNTPVSPNGDKEGGETPPIFAFIAAKPNGMTYRDIVTYHIIRAISM